MITPGFLVAFVVDPGGVQLGMLDGVLEVYETLIRIYVGISGKVLSAFCIWRSRLARWLLPTKAKSPGWSL